jgi:hypothetical protein
VATRASTNINPIAHKGDLERMPSGPLELLIALVFLLVIGFIVRAIVR